MSVQTLLIYFIAFEIVSSVAVFKFFAAAGRKPWEAWVPFYKTWATLEIIGRPKWWFILSLLPGVSNVITLVMIYELFYIFNFKKITYTLFTVATAGLYMAYIGFNEPLKLGERDEPDMKKRLGEFIPAFLFAVVAAAIIRGFTFEAYTIPTSSMEKSMKVGDFLFVSKLAYGVRLPMTPLSIPLVHNELPVIGGKSYADFIELPYIRLPKLETIDRHDAVVFNYPRRDYDGADLRPIDKRTHYVKRCLGVAGDTLEIINTGVYINGKLEELPERANGMFSYYVKTNGVGFNAKRLKEQFGLNYLTIQQIRENNDIGDVIFPGLPFFQGNQNEYIINIPNKQVEEFKALPNVELILPINSLPEGEAYPENSPPNYVRYCIQNANSKEIFPNPGSEHGAAIFNYTRDNYGPIYIPRKGESIELNKENYYTYYTAITEYEGNELVEKEGIYFLNGHPATSYTFQQNYYWMMGDNRHNSADSRMWGFVPEDHIVGKPVFTWMSWDKYAKGLKKIRAEKVFTLVHGEGESKSYFWPIAILIGIGYGLYYYFVKRKQKSNAK